VTALGRENQVVDFVRSLKSPELWDGQTAERIIEIISAQTGTVPLNPIDITVSAVTMTASAATPAPTVSTTDYHGAYVSAVTIWFLEPGIRFLNPAINVKIELVMPPPTKIERSD